MAISRILVLAEESRPVEGLRLAVFDRTVEFEFRTPSQLLGAPFDPSLYAAVAAQIDCATPSLLAALGNGDAGPPVFLFHREPPLPDIARWVAWPGPRGDIEGTPAGRLLSESLEYYSLASLYQQCLKIMTAQDEEKLLSQITDTFVHELGAESCVIWRVSPSDPDEMMIASVRGFLSISHEGSRFFLSQVDWADRIWRGSPFLFEAAAEAKGPADKGGGGALYIPLLFQEAPTGLVKLGPRINRKNYEERELNVARIIADYAASSLKNADRMSRMEKISLRDPETHAYSAAFLADYFEKEIYKANRFRRPLSVVFLVVHNFAFLMEQTRESLVVGALATAADEIRKALRDSDLLARTAPDRFCIVLPETDAFGATLAVRRIRKTIRSKSAIAFLGTEHRLQPFFMSATFPRDGKTFQELQRSAEEAYGRQQKSPYHRLRLQDKPFWDAYDVLVGKPAYYDRLRGGEDVPFFSRIRRDMGRNGHFILARETFLRMVEAIAQDVVASAGERGLVIAAGPRPEIFRQIFLSFGGEAAPGRRIYLVGQTGATRFDAKNLLYVSTDDDRLKHREVVLSLKENGAYGLFAADRHDGVCGFNTADEWLVESMMEKLQELYLLQGHF
ncbi:MAG: diguanylate cyclase [Deltaproteobacteria bacterium]|nr:diguanylate cyclase [Deltaproteobacteria bacterium]